MKRMFLVEQALDLFYQLDDVVYSSSSESESGDDEIDDSAFVVHDERDDEQPGPSTTPTTSRQRPTQRGGGRKSQTRLRSPAKSGEPHHSSEPWKTESDPGDSGGPMVIRQGATWIQAGVVSFGQGCALPNLPGVYARVSKYQDWINQHVGMNNAGFIPFNSSAPVLDETCPTSAPVCGGSAGLWPWMASVTYRNNPMCVGTLVSDLFVMTSVGCFARFMGTDGWEVVLNVVQWDCSSMPIATDVANVFFDDILGNGVALLQLSHPFSQVANLPVDMYNLNFGPGTQCSVIGWDSNAFTYLPFQELQTTVVSCDPSQTTHINICTERLNVQQDDDGSPLLCKMNDMWVQAGILSIPPGSEFDPYSNSTVFIQTTPFSYFLTNTLYNVPSILDGAESFSPLSLTYILLLSLPAVLQAFY